MDPWPHIQPGRMYPIIWVLFIQSAISVNHPGIIIYIHQMVLYKVPEHSIKPDDLWEPVAGPDASKNPMRAIRNTKPLLYDWPGQLHHRHNISKHIFQGIGPLFSAISLIPASMTTADGFRLMTSGRNLSSIVGWFVHWYPVDIRFIDKKSTVKHFPEFCNGIAHKHYPLLSFEGNPAISLSFE